MSLYQGYAQQRGFNPVDIPDPSEKIRKQGLRQLAYMKDEWDSYEKNARRIADQVNENTQTTLDQLASRFQDKKDYGQILANHRWKQFETSIKNQRVKADQARKDFQGLLQFTKTGAAAYKQWDIKQKKNIDNFAAEIYRDYGIDREKFDAIRNLQSSVLKNDTELNAALIKMQLDGVPLDVIARIRRGGGYMNIAVGKLSARRRAQQLPQYLAEQSNTELDLPGFKGLTLNNARGPNVDTALQELTSRFFQDENGEQLFSSKMMELGGTNALIDQAKIEWRARDRTRTFNEEAKDQHKSVITLIHDFTGYDADIGRQKGAEGIPLLVEHLAGGPNASARSFKIAKRKVHAALVEGLKNGSVKWATVEGLETLLVSHKSSKEKQPWAKLNPTLFRELERAGMSYDQHAQDAVILQEAGLRDEGREFYKNMVQLNEDYDGEIPTEILQQMLGYGTKRGTHFAAGTQYLQKIQAYGQQTINDRVGQAELLAKSERGEIITNEDIEKWNLSRTVETQVRALVRKYNTYLPQEGKDGTKERLKFRIESQLNHLIQKETAWYTSETWLDTRIHAEQEAARYYRTARESGKSHHDSYIYARDLITRDIETGGKDGYYKKTHKKGVPEFRGALAKKQDVIEINREEIATELVENPNLIYSKRYIDPVDLRILSAKANKGLWPEMNGKAMLIQSITKGKVSAVDVLQAQLQGIINEEKAISGASTTQLLPKSYVEKYKKTNAIISPFAQHLLESYNLVDINKAAMTPHEDGSRSSPVYIKPIMQKGITKSEEIMGREPTEMEKFYLDRIDAVLDDKTGKFQSPFNMHDPALLNYDAYLYLYNNKRYELQEATP